MTTSITASNTMFGPDLLRSLARMLAAPEGEFERAMSELMSVQVPHRALIIFAAEDVGESIKGHGDQAVTAGVSVAELEDIRNRVAAASSDRMDALLGGVSRPVLAVVASTGALMVLIEPRRRASEFVGLLWEIAASRLEHRAREASPAYLVESRAVASVRSEAVTRWADQQMGTLESLLAVLRSRELADGTARQVATELATEAVLHLRADTDRALTFGEEPVVRAFERLRDDLEPLLKYRKIDVQFVEPPTDGRALPSEVAHGARAVVRGAILGLVDQANVTRVRLQWDCDGKNLLVEVRDDGPGDLTADSVQVQTMRQRVLALGGHLSLEATRGWGSQLSVVLPLDPAPLVADRSLIATLSEREVDVMQCVAAGLRNRAVATRLGISENTVKFHLSRIFRKLSISSRAELAGILHGEGIHAPRGVAPQS